MARTAWFHVDVTSPNAKDVTLKVLQRYAPTRLGPLPSADSIEPAQRSRFAGLVVELTARDPQQLEASVADSAALFLPTLALLPSADGRVINMLARFGIVSSILPAQPTTLAAFAQRALSLHIAPSERFAQALAQFTDAHGLTAREWQLLAYAVGGEPRPQLMAILGVSENTLKTQIRGLLRKCGERSMDALANKFLLSLHRPRYEPETQSESTNASQGEAERVARIA